MISRLEIRTTHGTTTEWSAVNRLWIIVPLFAFLVAASAHAGWVVGGWLR